MIPRICVVLCIAFAPSVADAGSCAVRVRQQVVAQQVVYPAAVQVQAVQAYVAPVAVAQLVAVPVQVPAYSVGYDGTGQELRELKEAILELRQGLQQMRLGGRDQLRGPEEQAVAIFNNKCASCHEGSVSQAKGDGFTLLNGRQLAVPDDKHLALIASKTALGHMPKQGAKLTPEELGTVMEWVEAQSAK